MWRRGGDECRGSLLFGTWVFWSLLSKQEMEGCWCAKDGGSARLHKLGLVLAVGGGKCHRPGSAPWQQGRRGSSS